MEPRSAESASQCRRCGIANPRRICDAKRFERPVAAMIRRSVTPWRPGRISRLNSRSSAGPDQSRFVRWRCIIIARCRSAPISSVLIGANPHIRQRLPGRVVRQSGQRRCGFASLSCFRRRSIVVSIRARGRSRTSRLFPRRLFRGVIATVGESVKPVHDALHDRCDGRSPAPHRAGEFVGQVGCDPAAAIPLLDKVT